MQSAPFSVPICARNRFIKYSRICYNNIWRVLLGLYPKVEVDDVLAKFIFWELQVAIAFCFLAALSSLIPVFDFIFMLILIVSAALVNILQEG